MASLHARDADGTWFEGVDATLAAWQAAGVGRRLAWLRWPGIYWLAKRVYRWFARHRHLLGRWLGPRVCDEHCRQTAREQAGQGPARDGRRPQCDQRR